MLKWIGHLNVICRRVNTRPPAYNSSCFENNLKFVDLSFSLCNLRSYSERLLVMTSIGSTDLLFFEILILELDAFVNEVFIWLHISLVILISNWRFLHDIWWLLNLRGRSMYWNGVSLAAQLVLVILHLKALILGLLWLWWWLLHWTLSLDYIEHSWRFRLSSRSSYDVAQQRKDWSTHRSTDLAQNALWLLLLCLLYFWRRTIDQFFFLLFHDWHELLWWWVGVIFGTNTFCWHIVKVALLLRLFLEANFFWLFIKIELVDILRSNFRKGFKVEIIGVFWSWVLNCTKLEIIVGSSCIIRLWRSKIEIICGSFIYSHRLFILLMLITLLLSKIEIIHNLLLTLRWWCFRCFFIVIENRLFNIGLSIIKFKFNIRLILILISSESTIILLFELLILLILWIPCLFISIWWRWKTKFIKCIRSWSLRGSSEVEIIELILITWWRHIKIHFISFGLRLFFFISRSCFKHTCVMNWWTDYWFAQLRLLGSWSILIVIIFIVLTIFKFVNIGIVLGMRVLYFFLVQNLGSKTILGLDAVALCTLIPKLSWCFIETILSYWLHTATWLNHFFLIVSTKIEILKLIILVYLSSEHLLVPMGFIVVRILLMRLLTKVESLSLSTSTRIILWLIDWPSKIEITTWRLTMLWVAKIEIVICLWLIFRLNLLSAKLLFIEVNLLILNIHSWVHIRFEVRLICSRLLLMVIKIILEYHFCILKCFLIAQHFLKQTLRIWNMLSNFIWHKLVNTHFSKSDSFVDLLKSWWPI